MKIKILIPLFSKYFFFNLLKLLVNIITFLFFIFFKILTFFFKFKFLSMIITDGDFFSKPLILQSKKELSWFIVFDVDITQS